MIILKALNLLIIDAAVHFGVMVFSESTFSEEQAVRAVETQFAPSSFATLLRRPIVPTCQNSIILEYTSFWFRICSTRIFECFDRCFQPLRQICDSLRLYKLHHKNNTEHQGALGALLLLGMPGQSYKVSHLLLTPRWEIYARAVNMVC